MCYFSLKLEHIKIEITHKELFLLCHKAVRELSCALTLSSAGTMSSIILHISEGQLR